MFHSTIRTTCPEQGHFVSTITVNLNGLEPDETIPEVLVGSGGVVAILDGKLADGGKHLARYVLMANATGLDKYTAETRFDSSYSPAFSGKAKEAIIFLSAPKTATEAPDFVLHPLFGDNPADLIPIVDTPGYTQSVPFIVSSSSTRIVVGFSYESTNAGCDPYMLFVTFYTGSSVAIAELVRIGSNKLTEIPRTFIGHEEEDISTLRIRFREAGVSPITLNSTGGWINTSLRSTDNGMQVTADNTVVDLAQLGISRFAIFADVDKATDDDFDSDYHPTIFVEQAADEQNYYEGPYYGMSDGLGTDWWFGPDNVGVFNKMTDRMILADKLSPRINPNVGGTDPTFGVVFAPPTSAALIRPLLNSAYDWGKHPMFWTLATAGIKANDPFTPIPTKTIPGFTSHNCQPFNDVDRNNATSGKAITGHFPINGQHMNFVMPSVAAFMTGSPALDYMLKLWFGILWHDRRHVLADFIGSPREEGRVAYSLVTAAMCGVIDPAVVEDYLANRALKVEAAADKWFTSEDGVNPTYCDYRDTPTKDYWTPWETAQATWGYYVAFKFLPKSVDVFRRMARRTARAVFLSIFESPSESRFGFSIPYRTKFRPDGKPPEPADMFKIEEGPDGLFAWSMPALRVMIALDAGTDSELDLAERILDETVGNLSENLVAYNMVLGDS